MKELRRPYLLFVVSLFVLMVTAEIAYLATSFFPSALEFDVGPSTGTYLTGFTESEEQPPVSFRWTGKEASLNFPPIARGSKATLELRYARFLPGTARTRVFLNGDQIHSASAQSGRFRTTTIPIELKTDELQFNIVTEDPAPEALGIAVDWLRLTGTRFRLPFSVWQPRLLVIGLFSLGLALGFAPFISVALSLPVIILQAFWFSQDPFGMIHVHNKVVVMSLVATMVLTLILSKLSASRWLPFLFIAGYLFKAAPLFHPSFYYADTRQHRLYTNIFSSSVGSIEERGVWTQKQMNTAYPRWVGGKAYAFPYSPVFFVPFTWLDVDERSLESWMKHVALLTGAIELPIVYLIARMLVGEGAALWACLLTAFLPPMSSRLLLSMWPTVSGHLLELVTLGFAARIQAFGFRPRDIFAYGSAGLLSSLTYVSSLINFSTFTMVLASFERKKALILLATGTVVGLLTVFLLYQSFAITFLQEILPALQVEIMTNRTETTNPAAGLEVALRRIPLFYGLVYPILALTGTIIVWRRGPAATFHWFVVYGLTFLLLVLYRAGTGIFKDLKEILFVGPLIAITSGVSLEAIGGLTKGSRLWPRLCAGAIALGLIVFGIVKVAHYWAPFALLAGLD